MTVPIAIIAQALLGRIERIDQEIDSKQHELRRLQGKVDFRIDFLVAEITDLEIERSELVRDFGED